VLEAAPELHDPRSEVVGGQPLPMRPRRERRAASLLASSSGSAGPGFRPDIEGLRAVAILAVVAFHGSAPGFGGGFVGVDVFFVISGFLVTGQLLHPTAGGSLPRLGTFYARRARRILPAAGLVLVVVLAASRLVLSPLRLRDLDLDALAAALYVPNWRFAAQQVDYLQAGREVSPLLHYWSLGAEEQFYLAWPPVLLACLLLARYRRLRPPVLLVPALAALTAGSLLLSLRQTQSQQAWAYFGSPARAWQFGIGAALAVAGWYLPSARSAGPWRAPLGWAGLGAVAASVAVLTEASRYPGWAALVPTLGTAAVIGAGTGAGALPGAPTDTGAGGLTEVGRLLGTAPMRFLGRLSFSWYLWHWPAVVLTEAVTGPLTWPLRTAVAVAAAGPAWLTLRLFEQPIRTSPRLAGRTGRSLVVGAVATALPVLLAVLSLTGVAGSSGAGGTATSDGGSSSAAALPRPSPGSDPFAVAVPGGGLVPTAEQGRDDFARYPKGCMVEPAVTVSPACRVDAAKGRGRVVLLGDSHAAQWYDAVHEITARRGLELEVLLKGACPLPAISYSPPQLKRPFTECDSWRENTLRRLAAEPRPVAVLIGSWNRYSPDKALVADGWQAVVTRLVGLGAPIGYLADTPYPDLDVPACVSGKPVPAAACDFGRAQALPFDPMVEAIGNGWVRQTSVLDLNRYLCPPGPATCPVVRGGVLLYRDESHLTRTATLRLEAELEAQLVRTNLLPAG
jgi:peptidoglycan/LPS O-acetylase OafA/YrhL